MSEAKIIDADIPLRKIQRIVAECRAWELVEVLRAAMADKPGWRLDAESVLLMVEGGLMPKPQ